MNVVTVRHNFETAHRLFGQGRGGGKCWNLHGHSWWVEVDVAAPGLDDRGMVVEFGDFKHALRTFVDEELDHGCMLNIEDPLMWALNGEGCKIFTFHSDPTVEAVANLFEHVASSLLLEVEHVVGAHVAAVRIQETHVNGASWCLT